MALFSKKQKRDLSLIDGRCTTLSIDMGEKMKKIFSNVITGLCVSFVVSASSVEHAAAMLYSTESNRSPAADLAALSPRVNGSGYHPAAAAGGDNALQQGCNGYH
jgi:hypothetical protein